MDVASFSPALWKTHPVYSDFEGMYYIYNVPPRSYTLEVWIDGPQPMIFDISVTQGIPVTDIAPIRVR
jgi:hypothetical protein